MLESWKRWDEESIGDLDGRRVIITGGNSGIGLEAAKHLARAGADVVIACRNPVKAEEALAKIRAAVPGAIVRAETLDLANLESIQQFTERYLASGEPLDILINNAGVMFPPLERTVDGFELQMGTNHLGHFALTLPLLPLLEQSDAPRVVVVASHAHVPGRIDFQNLNAERSYVAPREYSQSKLANLLFAFELQARLSDAGSRIRVTSAHPGYCDTELQQRPKERNQGVIGPVMILAAKIFAQNASLGSLPTVRAAVDPSLQSGDYIGPHAFGGVRGYPVVTWRMPAARDPKVAKKLWAISEDLTGVRWSDPVQAQAAAS